MEITALIPNLEIPSVKSAAKELGIDFFVIQTFSTCSEIKFLIEDYHSLISIGIIAGMNMAYTNFKQPFADALIRLENKVEKFKKRQ